MKFPKHIQMQMKLPRYKNKQDLCKLINLIEGLKFALRRMAPSTFDETRLIHSFVQHILALSNSHEQCFHLSPRLNPLQKTRAQDALNGLMNVRAYPAPLDTHSQCSILNTPDIEVSVDGIDLPTSFEIDDISDDRHTTLSLEDFDSDDEIIMVELSVEHNHVEERILAEELSSFIDIEFPHPLYSSFHHAEMIKNSSGIYQGLPPEQLYKAAQLILVNVLNKDEVCIQNLMLEATSFLNSAPELYPSHECPRGLWDWVKIQRRKGENVKNTVILMCSLLDPEKERPALSWLLGCRDAINCRHPAQWTR